MTRLSLALLGTVEIVYAGRPLPAHQASKVTALLIYLAIDPEQSHNREQLMELLWPGMPQTSAQANLRQTLYRLRQIIPECSTIDGEETAAFLLADRHIVRVNPKVTYELDVANFERLTSRNAFPGQLEEAITLYRGEFLEDFYLPDSSEFETWTAGVRERLRRRALRALEGLTADLIGRSDYARAEQYARRQLQMDDLRESAHHQLMEILALGGRRMEALHHYRDYVQDLESELGATPSQEISELYERIQGEDLAAKQTSREVEPTEVTTTRHNLLPQPTPFIGRDGELAQLDTMLADPDTRLITVVGPGGMGKTRLAIACAYRQVHRMDDGLDSRSRPSKTCSYDYGVFFVNLAPLDSVDNIPLVVAEVLEIQLSHGEVRKQLLEYLRDKEMLLILDNFEHLLAGASLVSDVLQAAPGVQILVTSRERLRLRQEQLYPIRGLNYPDRSSQEGTDEFTAVELFLSAARRIQPDFELATGDLAHLARICQIVDGMPLALELTAGWVELLPLAEIAAEIAPGESSDGARSLDLLETEIRDVPDRHRSMRHVFEVTWERLEPAEREMLEKLSVFRGGFTREAARQVAIGQDGAAASLRMLVRLANKSLLQVNQSRDRYQIHELLRQYGWERLETSGELDAARTAHANYYLELLILREQDLKGGQGQKDALVEIESDLPNIRSAWEWALKQRDLDILDRAMEALFLYYELRGELAEAESVFGRSVSLLSKAINEETDPSTKGALDKLTGYLLVFHGVMAAHTGSENGLTLTRQGLELVKRYKRDSCPQDQYREAFCHMWLGWTSFLPGFYEDAKKHLNESRTMFSALKEPWGVARSLYMLSNPLIAEGQFAEAEQALRQSLSICREIQDAHSRIMVNRTLAILTLWFGDLPLTEQLLEEAVSLCREFNDQSGLQSALRELGKLEIARGELEQAAQTLQRSITICYDIGAKWEGELTYCDVGDLLRVKGDYEAAEKTLQRALQAAITTKNPWWLPRCLAELGCLASYRKDYLGAKQLLSEALDLWEQLNHEPFYAWGLAQLGELAAAQGGDMLTEAKKLFRQSLELAIKHRLAPIALDVFTALANFYAQAGDLRRTIELLSIANYHPSSFYETKEKVRRLLDNLSVDSSSDMHTPLQDAPAPEWQDIAAELVSGQLLRG